MSKLRATYVCESANAKYAKELEEGSLFKKDQNVKWFCTNCGFIYEGKEAPKTCPVCEHPQGYFMVYNGI